MLFRWILISGLFLSVFGGSTRALAQRELGLSEYLRRVEAQNSGYLSKIKKIEGSEQKQADAERLVSSEFFSEAMWASDKSPVMTPNFNGTDRQSRRFELGIRSQWGGGVRTRLFAVSDNQLLREALAMPQPEMSLEKRGLAAELEWSLLRNGLGREQRFQEEALLASAQGDKTLAKFQATQLLVDAQLLYIRTAQLQEALQIQSELVRQGESLVSWATRQVRDRLLEPVHQSEAEIALEARRLGYEQREVELTTIRQQLFSALEEGQSLVRLESLNRLETQINAPRSLSQRADITARNQYLQAQRSQLLLQKEAYRPDLRLIAQYQGFLKRGSDNDTARCENPTACATRVLGLSFSMPLDQGTQRRGRDGIEAQALSQEWEVKRAQMESERDKRLIQEQLQKMSEQQTILRQLIRKQEERLEAERRRQRQGRATTFELIQAEQQLFEAREQLIVLRGHRLELMTQLKLYEVKP